MHINFLELAATTTPRILNYQDLAEEKKALIEALYHDNVDEGLVQWVETLLDEARESGYHGGYSDAHWFARGMED